MMPFLQPNQPFAFLIAHMALVFKILVWLKVGRYSWIDFFGIAMFHDVSDDLG